MNIELTLYNQDISKKKISKKRKNFINSIKEVNRDSFYTILSHLVFYVGVLLTIILIILCLIGNIHKFQAKKQIKSKSKDQIMFIKHRDELFSYITSNSHKELIKKSDTLTDDEKNTYLKNINNITKKSFDESAEIDIKRYNRMYNELYHQKDKTWATYEEFIKEFKKTNTLSKQLTYYGILPLIRHDLTMDHFRHGMRGSWAPINIMQESGRNSDVIKNMTDLTAFYSRPESIYNPYDLIHSQMRGFGNISEVDEHIKQNMVILLSGQVY